MWKFYIEENASTMVEYAFLLSLIAVVVAGAAGFLGEAIHDSFEEVARILKKGLKCCD
jgi:Flp pilus assembly pilin Flp